MIKVWGRKNSINVQKVMWTLAELGVKHERIDAGGAFGRIKEPAYLRMNPNGLVPTIEDDGLVLWESNTIVRYLAAAYGAGALWPNDPARRAESDKWMDWQLSVAGPAMLPAFWGLIRTPPEQRDAKAIEASRLKCIDAFKILDAALARHFFVAGAEPTIGDIAVGVFVNRWFALPVERPTLSNLAAYQERLKERPGFAEHVAGIPLT
jgi:glutathione S-transferase